MKFYNREKEIEKLSRIASLSRSTSHMVVITGRRRVGKTELIRQFAKDREDIIYLHEKKKGRYYIKDPGMRFWFRYIFKNRSLVEFGDETGLTEKIKNDLTNLVGKSFEELIKALLIRRNMDGLLPLKFSRIGGFWTRKGDVEIDIVAMDEEGREILFGECKLKGSKFTSADAGRLKEKAKRVKWNIGRRKEHFALFSMETIPESQKKSLKNSGIPAFGLNDLLI